MSTTNVRFHALVQTTTALNTDRYIGRIGYDSTKARWVVSPDGSTWAESARRDVAETFAVSITSPSIVASTALRIAALNGMLAQTAGGDVRVATASDLPSHASRHQDGGADALAGQSIPGLRVGDSPNWAQVGVRASSTIAPVQFQEPGGLRRFEIRWDGPNDRLAIFSGADDGSQRSNRILVPRSDASTIGAYLGLNVASGALQVGGVDAITSAREGRFTGMRLSNFTTGQIPVASDANGQITASGETDDGTYFTTNRTFRAWNTLTKSGQLWTALQWTQSAEERVSILSSDASGVGGYHSMVLVPWDSDTADRGLGNIDWAQRVSGKSGTNPGLKVAMSGRSAGAGGSVSGYGGQWSLEYRPDNGANLVNAMRVGCFGGSTPDAVQADILLRANAQIITNFATIQDYSAEQPGIDLIFNGGASQFHIRGLNNATYAVLGGAIGDTEISAPSALRIGISTSRKIVIGDYIGGTPRISITALNLTSGFFSSVTTVNANHGASSEDIVIAYNGTGGHTETLPSAVGSGRIMIYTHIGTGTWTLQRQGSDVIRDGGLPTVTSIAILQNGTFNSRILMDIASGVWTRIGA